MTTPLTAVPPTPPPAPVVKLTKKGKPDKRSVTSKQNMAKAQSKVKEIVAKAKAKPVLPIVEEEDESSDSDTEYAIRKVKNKADVEVPVRPNSDVEMRMNELAKALDEMSEQNRALRNSFVKTNHLHKINSLSQNMLMKF